MRKKYTENDINQFFNNFKELPYSYKLEKVHQLINNPDAKAGHQVNSNFKPFKFIIMTSTIIIGITTIILWLSPGKVIEEKSPKAVKAKTFVSQTKKAESNKAITKAHRPKQTKPIIPVKETYEENDELIKTNSIASSKNVTNDLIEDKKIIWPVDSVLDGNKFIVTLTDAELMNIGFLIDETGLYYNNKFKDKLVCFHAWYKSNAGEITTVIPFLHRRNKKRISSNNDFYPVLISNNEFIPVNITKEEFALMNDTLLPVRIKNNQLKYGEEDIIIWFTISDNLLNLLPGRYKHLKNEFQEILNIKKQYQNTDIVSYKAESIIKKIHFFELSEKELQELGFVIETDKIQITTKSGIYYWQISLSKKSMGISPLKWFSKFEKEKAHLVFLSNKKGKQMLKWKSLGDNKDKMKNEYFANTIQNLVPIIIKQADYPNILIEDQVFWFEHNSLLPERISSHFKQKYSDSENKTTDESLEKTNQSKKSCLFEEINPKITISACKLYPNPANQSTTISFSVRERVNGSILLVSISGIEIKTLVPNTIFSETSNSFTLDLSGISSGIYIVLIKTSMGYKTQRLIISQ